MAPYAVAHLKLGMQLQQTGYKFGSDQRLGIFLTNTLDEAIKKSETLFAKWISDEANAAVEIKRDRPIMVVTGNPPYSSSVFEGRWIMDLIANYKEGLDEIKSDLNREEWKFLRFAQWRIEQTGSGIVAFIINNSFLDAITHRRMRQCLLEGFTNIYVLDLHGSVMSRKKTAGGGADQNVFEIEQGVCVVVLIREAEKIGTQVVHHYEILDNRQVKLDYLEQNSIDTTDWKTIYPKGPEFFFIPVEQSKKEEYEKGWKLTDIFLKYSSGIQTKKDKLTIHFDSARVLEVVNDFSKRDVESARNHYRLGDDSRDWSIERAQKDLKKTGITSDRVKPVLYRPFDIRFTYYTGNSRGFLGYPRKDIMQHMLIGSNVGLIAMRQVVGEQYSHIGVTKIINTHGTFYLGNRGQDYLFPTYLYTSSEDEDGQLRISNGPGAADRSPNLVPEFTKVLEKQTGFTFISDGFGDLKETLGPEAFVAYAYGVLHSPSYRAHYYHDLIRDFPRIPLTSNKKLFADLAGLGSQLISLHLLEAPKLQNFVTSFPVKGNDVVERFSYDEKNSRVWINDEQYFDGVASAVWLFEMGGYRICEKWLEQRNGRKLTYEEIQHYQIVIVAINETLLIMQEIDALVPSWPLP